MKRFSQIRQVLKALAFHPHSAGTILHDNTLWKAKYRKKHGTALPLPLIDIATFVPAESELTGVLFLGAGSAIPDLLLLQHLAMRPEVKTYFEIGTWRGESMSAVLPHVERAWSIDLDREGMQRERYSAIRQDQYYARILEREKVVILRADSRQFDFAAPGMQCDLIFIDGNHSYDVVASDTRNVFAHICHDRSIVVWHDYANDPENVRWEVYAAIRDAVPATLQPFLYHVSHTKCAILWMDGPQGLPPAEFPLQHYPGWHVRLSRTG